MIDPFWIALIGVILGALILKGIEAGLKRKRPSVAAIDSEASCPYFLTRIFEQRLYDAGIIEADGFTWCPNEDKCACLEHKVKMLKINLVVCNKRVEESQKKIEDNAKRLAASKWNTDKCTTCNRFNSEYGSWYCASCNPEGPSTCWGCQAYKKHTKANGYCRECNKKRNRTKEFYRTIDYSIASQGSYSPCEEKDYWNATNLRALVKSGMITTSEARDLGYGVLNDSIRSS